MQPCSLALHESVAQYTLMYMPMSINSNHRDSSESHARRSAVGAGAAGAAASGRK